MKDPAINERSRRRWPIVALVALVATAAAAVFLLPRLLDVEQFRGRIEAALEESTGWSVEIGTLRFSVLRGLVVTAGPVAMEPPGDDGTRVQVELIEIGARLRPLLAGRLVVDRVELVRPDAVLVKSDEAATWPIPVPRTESQPAGGTATQALEISIERISASGGTLVLDDRTSGASRTLRADDVELELFPVDDAMTGSATLAGGRGRLRWRGSTGSEPRIELELEDVATDVAVEWLGSELVHRGGTVSGVVRVEGTTSVDGTLRGRDMTFLAGERPLRDVEASFRIGREDERWLLRELRVSDGAAVMTGSGELSPALDLELVLPDTPIEAAVTASRAVFPVPVELEPPGTARSSIFVTRPVDGVLEYRARGRLAAAGIRPVDLLPAARDVAASYELTRDGVLGLRLEEGSLGGGPLTGTARLEPVVPPGELTFDGALNGAALGALLAGVIEEAPSRISGPADVAAKLVVDLRKGEIDLGGLGGRLDVNARDVTLPGWDLEAALRRRIDEKMGKIGKLVDLASRLDERLGEKLGRPDQARRGEGGGDAVAEVAQRLFDKFHVDVDLSGSPWKMDGMELLAGDLSASGRGTFDPTTGSVDIALRASLSEDRTAALLSRHPDLELLTGSSGRLTVPMRVRGSTLKPDIDVDLRGVVEGSLAGTAPGPPAPAGEGPAETSQNVEEKTAEAEQKIEEELEKKAGRLLEGLLGRKKKKAEEEPAPPPDDPPR